MVAINFCQYQVVLTTQELRIESLFPADEDTKELFSKYIQ